jgi:hypothetical protein
LVPAPVRLFPDANGYFLPCGDWSGSSGPRRFPAVARWRRRDARLAPPRLGAAAAPLLPSSHGTLIGEERKENPNGVGGLGTWGFAPLLDLYHGGARSDTKAPSCPRFDLQGGRVGTRLRRAGQASGERSTGQMGKIPLRLVPTPALVATRRSGQPGGRPSHQARACGRGRVSTRRAAGRKKVRGIRVRWLTRWPHRSAKEKQRGKSVGGLGCGASRSAGPVGLVGPSGWLRELAAHVGGYGFGKR